MGKRLGDSLDRGNLVLGTTAPPLSHFSDGMGGSVTFSNRRIAAVASSGRGPIEFEPGDRNANPRSPPRTAIP